MPIPHGLQRVVVPRQFDPLVEEEVAEEILVGKHPGTDLCLVRGGGGGEQGGDSGHCGVGRGEDDDAGIEQVVRPSAGIEGSEAAILPCPVSPPIS